uniref:Uncharacterized protein n=1 Tax=Romanomermis culicivorax TaxID=13658 RepID=A0A915K0N9_ROMCU
MHDKSNFDKENCHSSQKPSYLLLMLIITNNAPVQLSILAVSSVQPSLIICSMKRNFPCSSLSFIWQRPHLLLLTNARFKRKLWALIDHRKHASIETVEQNCSRVPGCLENLKKSGNLYLDCYDDNNNPSETDSISVVPNIFTIL